MKVYVLKQEDIDRLLSYLDRDPKWGYNGGSSTCFSKEEEEAHHSAHRFYNYQIRGWVKEVTK